MKTYIRAQAQPWNMGVALYIGDTDGKTVVEEITLKRVDDVPGAAPPSFTLDVERAQTLMDDLWNAGIRPTEGNGSAGAMRAVEQNLTDLRTHVADLRRIAFNALLIDTSTDPK